MDSLSSKNSTISPSATPHLKNHSAYPVTIQDITKKTVSITNTSAASAGNLVTKLSPAPTTTLPVHLLITPLASKRKTRHRQTPLPNPTRSKMVKKPKRGAFTRPVPIPSPEIKGKQREEQELLNKLVEEIYHDPAFDYNDIAHSNMTEEPCGDF